jgi:hypothetical protein
MELVTAIFPYSTPGVEKSFIIRDGLMEMSVRCGICTTTSSKLPGEVLPSREADKKI